MAVTAAHREMPATDHNVVGTVDFAVPAWCIADQFPGIVAPDLRECARLAHIFNTGDIDAGCTAVVTRDLCFVGNGLDDLVRHMVTVVTVNAMGQKDEPVAHVRYLHIGGL